MYIKELVVVNQVPVIEAYLFGYKAIVGQDPVSFEIGEREALLIAIVRVLQDLLDFKVPGAFLHFVSCKLKV